jgi:hypothetical protein
VKGIYSKTPCILCYERNATYVKLKGGFVKLCDSCKRLMEANNLTVPCDVVKAK